MYLHLVKIVIDKVKGVEVDQTLLEYSGDSLRFYIHRHIMKHIVYIF